MEIDLVAYTSSQDEVCKHAKKMMGRTRGIEVEPAPEAAVLHFKLTGKVKDGPSADQFQPDFSEKGPEKSLWNHRLVKVFTNDYVQKGLLVNEVKEVSPVLHVASKVIARHAPKKVYNCSFWQRNGP